MNKKRKEKNQEEYSSDSIIKQTVLFIENNPFIKYGAISIISISILVIVLHKPAMALYNHITSNSQANQAITKTLNPTITKLNNINKQLDDLMGYKAGSDENYSTTIINTTTNKTLSINDKEMFADIKYDGSIDLTPNKIDNTVFDKNHSFKYISTFLKPNIKNEQIYKLKEAWGAVKELKPTNYKNQNVNDQFTKEISVYKITKDRVNQTLLKISIESNLNELTETPIYSMPSVNVNAPLKTKISKSQYDDINDNITKLDKASNNNIILISKYKLALSTIQNQTDIITKAQSLVELAEKSMSDKSINDAQDAINLAKDSKLKSDMNDQLSKVKSKWNDQKKKEEALKKANDDKIKKEKEDKAKKDKLTHESSSTTSPSSTSQSSSSSTSQSSNPTNTKESTTNQPSITDLTPTSTTNAFQDSPNGNITVNLGNTNVIQTSNPSVKTWALNQNKSFKFNTSMQSLTIYKTQDIDKSNPSNILDHNSSDFLVATFINTNTLRIYYLK